MTYRIAGIDVHKRMLAVVIADVAVEGEYQFERRKVGTSPSVGFSETISDRKPVREGRHGFPLSVMPKIRYGRWIFFDVNQRYYERIGFWL